MFGAAATVGIFTTVSTMLKHEEALSFVCGLVTAATISYCVWHLIGALKEDK